VSLSRICSFVCGGKKKGVQDFMGDRGGGCELMETVAGFRIVSTLTVGL
jgi:hypothetical protein